ncbi:hypothetical protein [Amycolatopsis sp. VC5-11]|uniref:hypothetical protein n=1 Tax=Amycolatopsis sp. VC5-11 TaxID=3120156 RepID=UPI00300AF7A0
MLHTEMKDHPAQLAGTTGRPVETNTLENSMFDTEFTALPPERLSGEPEDEGYTWLQYLRSEINAVRAQVRLALVSKRQRRLPLHRQRAVRRALRLIEAAEWAHGVQVYDVLDQFTRLEKRFGVSAVRDAIAAYERFPRPVCEAYDDRADEHLKAVARMSMDLRVPSRFGIRTRVVSADPVTNRPDLEIADLEEFLARKHKPEAPDEVSVDLIRQYAELIERVESGAVPVSETRAELARIRGEEAPAAEGAK